MIEEFLFELENKMTSSCLVPWCYLHKDIIVERQEIGEFPVKTEPDHAVGVSVEPGHHRLTSLQQIQDVFSCHLKTTFVPSLSRCEQLSRAEDGGQVRA